MRNFYTTSTLLLAFFLLCGVSFTHAQQRVSGTVTDEAGDPVIGAAVLVRETKQGTTTDLDGTYSLLVPDGATLEFSFTGMTTQAVPVNGRSEINVVLATGNLELDEVVVTALGIKEDRRKLSYSIQAVKGSEVQATQRDNAFLSLQGRVAGLGITPTSGIAGGSMNIVLRGVNSIGSTNQPLVVLDGLPINAGVLNQHNLHSDGVGINGNVNNNRDDIGSRLNDINPNEIETITVLKGPEAAALYGNEGANGVILITTRKGKAGSGRVTYNNRFAMSELYRFPEIQQVYGRGRNGGVELTDPDYFGPKYESNTRFFNNIDNFFRQGSNQRHDLAFEGGSERMTYRLSASYFDTKGVIPTNSNKQLNAALSTEANLLPWLKGSARFNVIKNTSVLPPGGAQGYLTGILYFPSYLDGRDYLTPTGTRRLTLESATPGSDADNPFFTVYNNQRSDQSNRIISNITLDATIRPWLSVTGRFGADIASVEGNRFFHPESNIGFTPRGWTEDYTDLGRFLNGNFFATLKKTKGILKGSLLVGTSVDDRQNEVNSLYGERFYLPDFNSINNTDPITQRNKTILTRTRLVGVFSKLELNLNDFLIANITARNDWSSTLPKENWSYFYPSAGLTFVFSDLPFWKDKTGILDFGKLRASYAQVGNPAPPYKIRARLVPQTTTGGGFLYDFFGDNPNLKPERVESFEVGTDLSFFKGRISVDLAYFSKTISDQIVTQRLSYGTGFIFGLLNGGELNTEGLEVQLGLTPVRSSNFDWTISTNFTKYETRVVDLPADVSEYYDSDTWAYENARASAFATAEVLASRFNQPNNFFYTPAYSRGAGSATAIGGWSYLRNQRGDILVDTATGFPLRNANFLPIGDRNPDFTVGIINSFRVFKQLNLSFLLEVRRGGDVFNGNELYLTRTGLSKRTLNRDEPIVVKGVLRDGKENSENPTVNTKQIIPGKNELYYTTALQAEDFVERDINWLRLRDVTLTYNLPDRWLNNATKKVIKQASIFVNGTDLFLSTNYTGADPAVSTTSPATGGAGGFGMDFGKLSLPRTYSAGLSVTF
jgi:TonB-linked SusC/RagA family outer membrane protein